MKRRTQTNVIVIAIIASILLYLAGLFSGLYANKMTEERTATSLSQFEAEQREDLESFRSGTEEQIDSLNNYIRFLESNLNSIQLQEEFLATENDSCALSEITIQHMIEQLQFYRDRLPVRLEQYEKDHDLSGEYLRLKDQYNALSIRTWVFARNQQRECSSDVVTGLYLYSVTCEECVAQGEELDEFTRQLGQQNRSVLLFTVDANANNPMIRFLKTYYGIDETPAVVVNEHVFSGGIATPEMLFEAVE